MAVAGLVILGGLLVYFCLIPGLQSCGANPNQKIILTFWGVEPSSAMNEAFRTLGNNFKISYQEFDPKTYEDTLINALAAGTGPDVFEVNARSLPKHADKLLPASTDLISLPVFESLYPTVVEQDFAPNGIVYALPLYLDTLALFYNRDIFDSDHVALPPANWSDFQNLMPHLRRLDAQGRMIRGAAAIGSASRTVNRAPDLLSLLMLQDGTEMVSQDFSRASFSSPQGINALTFYTNFANPASTNLAWSETLGDSLDAFAAGKTAMVFGYAADLARLKEKNPTLAVGVVPVPQPTAAKSEVSYANYWGIGVSKRTNDPTGAWAFVHALAADVANAKNLADTLNRLPAIKTLITTKQNDPTWHVFANAALSARSWPEVDKVEVDKIFDTMIDDVVRGQRTVADAINKGQAAVTTLMENRQKKF